jgi:TPR repeat protein
MHLYAIAIRQGRWVAKNEEEGLKWMEQAARKNYPEAMYDLGVHRLNRQKKETEGLSLLEKAAERQFREGSQSLNLHFAPHHLFLRRCHCLGSLSVLDCLFVHRYPRTDLRTHMVGDLGLGKWMVL